MQNKSCLSLMCRVSFGTCLLHMLWCKGSWQCRQYSMSLQGMQSRSCLSS